MPPSHPASTIYDLATVLSEAVVDGLVAYQLARPRTMYVAAGTAELVAWDDCCEETAADDHDANPLTAALPPRHGQLTVALARLYRARAFPVEDITQRGNCEETRLVATFIVELVRCSTVVDADADVAPSAETLDAEGLRIMSDTMAIAAGVSCAVNAWNDANRNAVFGGIEPTGPAGTCVGNRATVHVEVAWSCLCPPV